MNKSTAIRCFVILALTLGAVMPSDAQVLHHFQCGSTTDGCGPSGRLIEASDGYLYGTTVSGVAFSQGTVFKIDKGGLGFSVLKSFSCSAADGCAPRDGLLDGGDGYLYGTTESGGPAEGGTIFKIGKDGSGFSVLRFFDCSTSDGCSSLPGLIDGGDGYLYGTTSTGGASDMGTVYRIRKNGNSFSILKSFTGADGNSPYARLLDGGDGYLYGTTVMGGVSDQGTVFRIRRNGSDFSLLKSFECIATDACRSSSSLTDGGDGYLYGTSPNGGPADQGALFKIRKDGSGFSLLKTLACSSMDGCAPIDELIDGGDGNLYGTTLTGWVNPGTAFKIGKDGSGFMVIKAFSGYFEEGFLQCPDGCIPRSSLVKGSDGNFYGTTTTGGLSGQDPGSEGGTLYRINRNVTPVGTTVPVLAVAAGNGSLLALEFENVTAAGQTAATSSTTGPAAPTGFTFGNPPTYYDVTTTASFAGQVKVCFPYNPFHYVHTSTLRVYHFHNSDPPVDVTISHDTTNHVICGQAASLSIFAIAQPLSPVSLSLSPAQAWIGLKNNDGVGIKFDLLAEVFVNGTLAASGQVNSVAGGGSGFNNANLDTIPLDLSAPIDFVPGSTLSIKLSVRNACSGSGSNSGTARLWYNDTGANSRLDVTFGGVPRSYNLVNGSALSSSAGSGPKLTIDVAAGAKCSPFKPFGTWGVTP